MYNKDLLGREVVSSDAWTVGTVRRVMVDQNGWRITALEVLWGDEGSKGVTKVADKIGGATDKVTSKLGVGPVTDKIGVSQPTDDDEKDRISIPIDKVQGVDDKILLKVPRNDLTPPTAEPKQQPIPA